MVRIFDKIIAYFGQASRLALTNINHGKFLSPSKQAYKIFWTLASYIMFSNLVWTHLYTFC